jgi:hypothetical protein
MRARKTFETLEATLGAASEAKQLDALHDPMARLDFANALAGLDALERHLGVTKENVN